MNTKKENYFISVIIPTVNRKSLRFVLEALNEQIRKPDEIIVMEDTNHLGPSVMRNEGIEKAKGDLIAFLDDDNVPDKNWLEIFVKKIDEYEADGVSGNYLEDDPFLHEIRIRRNFPQTAVVNPLGFFGTGGNCMYRKTSLEKCKKKDGFIFDPKFKISQDIELTWRMRSYGFKLVYVINDVRHLKMLNPVEFIRFQFHRGEGTNQLYMVHNSYRNVELGPSLLWDDSVKSNRMKKWVNVIWHRILGPFDYKSFSKLRYFILFWMGEKAKSLGFLFALLATEISEKNSSDKPR